MEWKESRGISRKTCASSASNCCRMEAKSGLRWGSCAQQSGTQHGGGTKLEGACGWLLSKAKELWPSPTRAIHSLTGHELCEGLRAGGRDGQCKLVNSHSVGHSKTVDATVGHLPSQ